MDAFELEIPMKDHPLVINVKQRDRENIPVFDLYYCDSLFGCIFCNEHNVWIYEPDRKPALLLDEDQIKHLGKELGRHTQ